ncbi:unnamed protein product [Coregonus sp. 'balchen']|nr:unnamed protein product [Coregonus sp. 'balchen']
MVDSQYYLPNDIGISALDCTEAFRLLSPREQLYAHYLSRSAWYGGLAVLLQTSPESASIYVLLQRLFRKQPPAQLGNVATAAGLSPEEYQAFLVYAAGLYANMGNYKSFGDTKFIPNLPKEKLKALVWQSQAFQDSPSEMEALWDSCSTLLFSLEDKQKQLGLGDKGITTYFSGNCCLEDAELAQKFLDSKVFIHVLKFVLLDGEGETGCGRYDFEDCVFTVSRGDYAHLMKKVSENLEKAKDHAANENQKRMLEEYSRSFTFGSVEAHKEGSRFWIKDKGPIVESYIGFIESYRDPFGSRGEFEGFVAVVNKAMSERFAKLVSSAEVLLPELPWPKDFEKDRFLLPDFTSLDVLTFAGSGIPAGINIPNCNETWDSKFSTISCSYEECRAECVGLYLCLNKHVLSIFGHEGEDAEEVVYINWLNMVRAGLLGLEFYTPESKSWRQAHMQARFVILRVLLEAGEGLVTLKESTGKDGRPDALITLDRSKIHTVGKAAIERFLCKLQVLKSTADVEGGRALYEGYSAVSDSGSHNFLCLRETVLQRKEARKMFVQANTRVKGDSVELVEYEGSAAGLIRSFTERFADDDAEEVEAHLLELNKRDAPCWF